ncbi:MAG: hypothetical protein CL912_33825 [Deltaproteobacteria bacterium]|nr:hypothetical protein [Deltaproteobacteria bacterium]
MEQFDGLGLRVLEPSKHDFLRFYLLFCFGTGTNGEVGRGWISIDLENGFRYMVSQGLGD